MLIGICGKSGSGKTTLANMFVEKEKAIHLDIDKIGHLVLTFSDVKNELIKNFGRYIIINNKVDRKTLGSIVFNSKEKMDKLIDITWPYMEKEIDKLLLENQNKVIVLDWLLLPKTKYFLMCDKRVLLDIPIDIRRKRVIERDKITKDQFYIRDKAGPSYNKNDFNYVISSDNKEILEELIKLL